MQAEQILAFRLARSGLAGRARRTSPRRRPVPRRTSRATPRCWRAPRARKGSRVSATTRRSTAASSSSRTSCAARFTRSRRMTSRSTGAHSSHATTTSSSGSSASRSSGSRPRRASLPTDALAEVADADEGCPQGRPRAEQGRAARRATRAGRRRSAAVVRGLQEPPRRADAVALREREGRRAAGLRAPVRPRQAGSRAGGGRGGSPVPALLRSGDERRLRRLGRPRQGTRRAALGAGRERARRGPPGRPPSVGARRRLGRARVSAGGEGRPSDPARRPLSAEAQPRPSRTGSRTKEAAVPACRQPRRSAEGWTARRPVARQGEGPQGGDHRRETGADRAQGSRRGGAAHRRPARAPRRSWSSTEVGVSGGRHAVPPGRRCDRGPARGRPSHR